MMTSLAMNENPNLDEIWTQKYGPPQRQVTAIVVGGGLRGTKYANFALDFPSRLKIVAAAEKKPHRLDYFRKNFGIRDDLAVLDWTKLAEQPKLADAAIIATQDQMHCEPAKAFAAKGYHILLEKPMSNQEDECVEITKAALDNNIILAVCHVLRYFPPCTKIREVIDSGVLGEVVTIQHTENILFWHFAHSFVRGNWRNESQSSFSLLAKSCHDIDLIMYWMGDKKCKKIQSFGGLYHFRKEQKPKEASNRCFDCQVESSCPYSAHKIYMKPGITSPKWPMSAVCDIEDHPKGYATALYEALQNGPYGRCVYECDNDVVDHQTVNMEFENGATAIFLMNAFTRNICRDTRICGTKGELRWDGEPQGGLFHYDFNTKTEREIPIELLCPPTARTRGHGGADFFLVESFVKTIASEGKINEVKTGAMDSLRSHKLVFAAEKSRRNNTIEYVDI